MFWLWLWMALTAGVMITSHITTARGDKWPSRALLEAIVANFRRTVGVARLVVLEWNCQGQTMGGPAAGT